MLKLFVLVPLQGILVLHILQMACIMSVSLTLKKFHTASMFHSNRVGQTPLAVDEMPLMELVNTKYLLHRFRIHTEYWPIPLAIKQLSKYLLLS